MLPVIYSFLIGVIIGTMLNYRKSSFMIFFPITSKMFNLSVVVNSVTDLSTFKF